MSRGLGGTRIFARVTSSQVRPMLLVPGPDLGNHSFGLMLSSIPGLKGRFRILHPTVQGLPSRGRSATSWMGLWTGVSKLLWWPPGKDSSTEQVPPFCQAFVVRSIRHVWLFATPWTAAHQSSPWNALKTLNQGSPTSKPRTSTSCQISSGVILEMKCIINRKRLNHLKTTPLPWSVEKVSSTKPIPGAKKFGGCWLNP